MITAQVISDIASKVVNEHKGELMLDTPVTIKFSPHSWPVKIHKINIDRFNNVWLMDGNGNWYQLEEKDTNAMLVANSIMQRLRLITMNNQCQEKQS